MCCCRLIVVIFSVRNGTWSGLLLWAMFLPAPVLGVAGPWRRKAKKRDLWVLASI